MRYGIFFLALGLVWSSQVSAQSVYVAPGGVYIASANVHVGAGNGYPTYGAPRRRVLRTLRHSTRIRAGLCAPRDRYTEHPPSTKAKAMDLCIRRPRPTLISPICMRRNFRRGRLPLCPTTTGRVVASIKPMVGWDTVTDICRDKGRFSGEPSFASIWVDAFLWRATG